MRSSLVFITALSVLLHSLFPLLFSSLPTSPLVTKTEPSSSSPALGELFFDLSWRCSWPVINIREQLSPLPSSRRRRCPADFSRTPLSPSSKGKASRFASYSKNRAARKEDRSSDVELFRAWASVWNSSKIVQVGWEIEILGISTNGNCREMFTLLELWERIVNL